MAIDLTIERGLSLSEAAKLVPSSRRGKATHVSRLVRWISQGVKDGRGGVVRLEALRLGGQWVTSAEAIQRFAERLTPSDHTSSGFPQPAVRRKAVERAEKELNSLGV
jgi:hypothetical protein